MKHAAKRQGKKGEFTSNGALWCHSDVRRRPLPFPWPQLSWVLKPFINNSWSSLSLEGVWLSGSKGLPLFYSFFPLSARVQHCTEDACVRLGGCLFDFFQWSTAKRLACFCAGAIADFMYSHLALICFEAFLEGNLQLEQTVSPKKLSLHLSTRNL